VIQRGQIWWAELRGPRGSEPGYRHPVLVLQRDEVNRSRINTVVVCLLTSNTVWSRAPGNTLLRRRRSGLPRDSVVNASQVATLNKSDLEEFVADLPRDLMDDVDQGIRWFLGLD
jgi:mRNA interferase MazF